MTAIRWNTRYGWKLNTPDMNLSAKRLVQILEENGFVLKRMGKGSHHIYFNSITKVTVPVPIHNKDLKKGTFMGILKDAGIDTRKLFE